MHDELTEVDIKKMQEELEYRRIELRPKLIEDVKTAREFGDLSENFEYKEIELVTTLRQNALKGLISKESPVGKAVMGHKTGDRVLVAVNPDYSYYIQIRKVVKGTDDESLPISAY